MLSTGTSNEAKMARSREERVRRRAEELYRLRGDEPGSALDDWLLAEREIDLEEGAIDESLENLSQRAIHPRSASQRKVSGGKGNT